MLEIHTHLLYGVDDGAADINETIDMINDMILNGVHSAIATPHHLNGFDDNPFSEVDERVKALNEYLRKNDIPFKVYPGQEVRANEDLVSLIKSGNIKGLARSRYLLIELPHSTVPVYLREILYNIIVLGYVPIIAHPERNRAIQSDISLLSALTDMGCLAQLTSSSILSKSKNISKTSEILIESGCISIVSSDSHNITNRRCNLKKALEKISVLYGKRYADYLISNSNSVIENSEIKDFDFEITKQNILKRLFRI